MAQMRVLFLMAAALMVSPAMAQTTPKRLPPPRPASAPAATAVVPAATPATTAAAPAPATAKVLTPAQVQQNPLQLLQQFSLGDLQAALADANAQTPPDMTSANCYTALITLVQSPVNNPLPAGPGVFQALQKARDIKAFLSNLQTPNGPLSQLNISCAPLVMDVNSTLLALGLQTGLVAGVGVATGGLGLPALPALGGLLSLLPIK